MEHKEKSVYPLEEYINDWYEEICQDRHLSMDTIMGGHIRIEMSVSFKPGHIKSELYPSGLIVRALFSFCNNGGGIYGQRKITFTNKDFSGMMVPILEAIESPLARVNIQVLPKAIVSITTDEYPYSFEISSPELRATDILNLTSCFLRQNDPSPDRIDSLETWYRLFDGRTIRFLVYMKPVNGIANMTATEFATNRDAESEPATDEDLDAILTSTAEDVTPFEMREPEEKNTKFDSETARREFIKNQIDQLSKKTAGMEDMTLSVEEAEEILAKRDKREGSLFSEEPDKLTLKMEALAELTLCKDAQNKLDDEKAQCEKPKTLTTEELDAIAERNKQNKVMDAHMASLKEAMDASHKEAVEKAYAEPHELTPEEKIMQQAKALRGKVDSDMAELDAIARETNNV